MRWNGEGRWGMRGGKMRGLGDIEIRYLERGVLGTFNG